MSLAGCVFSFDGLNHFYVDPYVSRIAVTENISWVIDFGAAYCANDMPNPCLRWTITNNNGTHTVLCRVANNKQSWVYEGDGTFHFESMVLDNSQEPVFSCCDEHGRQYKSRLTVKGTLRFSISH
jgi:hypothetical protein